MGEASFLKRTLVLTFFFISGAFSAVLGNIMYSQESTGLHHVVKPFRKPWFQGWSMFVAMTLLIFDTPCFRECRCPAWESDGPVRGWGLFRLVSVPALCDLFATLLQNIALLYLAPSVWQMTRGSILLFTALFAIFYRKQTLHAVDWFGVLITMVGIVLVGLSSFLSASNSTAKASPLMSLVSVILVVLAQGLQGFQTIVEEELLHDVDATENEIVSFEGIWGLLISSFVTLPIANCVSEDAGEGLYENSIESFVMLFNSGTLIFLTFGYMGAILVYNLTGMLVTSFSSAIHRNIYEALRSAAVWVLSVFIGYVFPSSGGGERLSVYSLIELAGFMLSIYGSFVYNRVVKLSCFEYHENEEPLIAKE